MTDKEIEEQAIKSFQQATNANYEVNVKSALKLAQMAFIEGAKWMQQNKCRHRLVSAKNEIIQDGFYCVDCGELFGEYKGN